MEIKILQVFYGKDGLPYKDKDRQVHFPIIGTGFLGASNTTKIKFYYDELDNLDETTWVAVSKLPNGKVGSRVLESHLDSELNEHYALLELDNYYTKYKGDVFISLQGYQGGVDFDYDEENSQYEIHGTPTIAATGSIKFTINYANQFVGSGETDNINFQRILAALGTKLGMRAYSEHVEELPSEGSPDIFYVVNDDPNNPNLANIYIWNENTEHYVWVGDNTLDLGEYYTKEQGDQFESDIDNRVSSVENELSSVAQGSPKGVYATVSALETAYPTGTTGIYVVSANGHWYYWNGSAWTDGGVYQATGIASNSIVNDMIVDNTIKGNKISPEKLFTSETDLSGDATYVDGKYMGSNGTEGTFATLSYGQIDVEGYDYIVFSCYTNVLASGNNPCCLRNKAGNIVPTSEYYPNLEIIDQSDTQNYILRVKLPINSKTFYYNIWTASKSSVVLKGQIYNETKKILWIKIDSENIDDNSISAKKINTDLVYGEEIIGDILSGGFFDQLGDDRISFQSNENISYWKFDVEEGKTYILYLSSGEGAYTTSYDAYFNFTNDELIEGVNPASIATCGSGLASKSKYIKNLGSGYFLVTMPKDTQYFYTASGNNALTNKMNKNENISFDWLIVKKENFEGGSIQPSMLFKDSIQGDEIEGSSTVGGYFTQNLLNVSYVSNSSIAWWSYEVEEDKTYVVYLSSGETAIDVIDAYFIFTNDELSTVSSQNQGKAVILNSEKTDYVKSLGAGYFEVSMPKGTRYFYTASGSVATQMTNKMYETQQEEIKWIKLGTGNFQKNTIPENAIIKDGSDNKGYKYWDSLNKPFNFDNKNLVAFGDSITAGVANEGSGNYDAGSDKYISLFASKFNMALNNQAVSGSRFASGGQYGSICSKITSFTFSNNQNEIVFIAGGTNDFNSGSPLGELGDTTDTTFYGALDVVCNYLKDNAPNSTIIFITPINVNRNESAFPNATNPLNDYRNAIWEVATKYKFNVVDGSTIGFAKGVNTPWGNLMIAIEDGTHPTLAGHSLYFRGLCGKLK